MTSYRMKAHDTAPPITVIVVDPDGYPEDLTSFSSVKFLMRRRGDTELTVDRAAVFVDKTQGVVRYLWQAGDTAEPGVYYAEFELQGPGGLKQTAPARGQLRIDIEADLDDA